MVESQTTTRASQEGAPGRVSRYFDGINYLWQRAETRFILKLMFLLFGSMLVFYAVIFFLMTNFGESNFLIRATLYGEPFFLALFTFILFELIQLYRIDIRQKMATTENSLKSSGQMKSKSKLRFGILLILTVFVVCCYVFLLLYEIFYYGFIAVITALILFHYWFGLGYTFFLFGLLFITGFVAARGTIASFEEKYLERFQQRPNSFFLLLPLPWILLIALFFSGSIINLLYGIFSDITIVNIYLWALLVYGFLCITSILVAFKPNWRAGFAVSQLASSLAFFFTILLPFFVDMILSVRSLFFPSFGVGLGSILSLLALAFFYVQGSLDEYGDALRQFHTVWDRTIQKIRGLSGLKGATHPKESMVDTVSFVTKMQNPYRKAALGLTLFLLTFFGIIIVLAPIFPVLGVVEGIDQIETLLLLDSYFEMGGIGLGAIIYIIMISFLKAPESPV